MTLALFDLDNTLLAGDSDYLWGQFLVKNKMVDGTLFERENQRFFEEYKEGILDIQAYLGFQLGVLAQYDKKKLDQLRLVFLEEMIRPIIAPQALSILEKHRGQGDRLVIITATNRFVTTPIAQALGVDHLIATEVEVREGQYTGRPKGTPCFQEGKVTLLNQWLKSNSQNLSGSWFYSDSHNDLPLLKVVDNPVVVDPDEKLALYAKQAGWPVISLRS
ncbi:MAG: HAD family hydrolase [Magnetococcales bacterium]|nr:HAD family hydrolase [Magnetococcales bacterium]